MKRLVVPFEVKGLKERQIEGYGSTFGNVDLGGDIVTPGAFLKSLANHAKSGTMPKMLWNHRSADLPIGVWTDIKEDKKGLWMVGEFADTQMGNDVRTLARMKAIDSMSIGYYPVDVGYDKNGNRLLKEIELAEVSPVNFPMNPRAVIHGAKSLFDPRKLEHHLREQGCSKSVAREAVHEVFDRCDAETEDNRCDADVAAAKAVIDKFLIATMKPPSFS